MPVQLYSPLEEARFQRARLGIPVERYRQWRAQRNNAVQRGIVWQFTLPEWCSWWDEALKDGGERARRADQLVMARYGDVGPYAPGNVYPAAPKRNYRDRPPEMVALSVALMRASREANGHSLGEHLRGARGDAHPRSKAVISPKGRFGSLALAAEAFGVTRGAVHQWLRDGRPGWAYEAPE